MNHVEAIVIALLQGVSELFPVSSLGHAVLLPKLLHWGIDEKSKGWLAFLVALHLGTAIALLIYFRDDWIDVFRALFRSVQRGRMSNDHDERLAWMVILGTIPAGLVGFVLKDPLSSLFASPYIAASALIVNGGIMFLGERFIQAQAAADSPPARGLRNFRGARRRRGPSPDTVNRYRDITQLSWRDAAIVGFAQIGALVPGISRSGITIVAGLGAGLTHEASARFTFLLATPVIFAASVLELPELFQPGGRSVLGDAIVGLFLAGGAAYLSVRFLMRYFQTGRLYPFAAYCVAGGAVSLVLLSTT